MFMEAILEATSLSFEAIDATVPVYGVARLVGRSAGHAGPARPVRVLAMIDTAQHAEVILEERQCIPVPTSLGAEEALLALPLAMALCVWDRLYLELGEAAVYTEGDWCADLIGQVAIWRGGCPVIRLGNDPARAPLLMGEQQLLSDPEEALHRLAKRVRNSPGFAAIDLSGRPETIDLLLEVVPRWGRVMLAGRTCTPLTVDFYNNVHRKGLVLLTSILAPSSAFQKAESEAYLSPAFRLLENSDVVATCSQLVPRKRIL